MYGFGKILDCSLEAAVERVTQALQAEGFGVLTEIDVQATLKKKLDIDRPAYRILGACNPTFANEALDADPEIGLLLPCNVVVREESDGIHVSFMDPAAVLGLVNQETITRIGQAVREKLLRVKDSL